MMNVPAVMDDDGIVVRTKLLSYMHTLTQKKNVCFLLCYIYVYTNQTIYCFLFLV